MPLDALQPYLNAVGQGQRTRLSMLAYAAARRQELERQSLLMRLKAKDELESEKRKAAADAENQTREYNDRVSLLNLQDQLLGERQAQDDARTAERDRLRFATELENAKSLAKYRSGLLGLGGSNSSQATQAPTGTPYIKSPAEWQVRSYGAMTPVGQNLARQESEYSGQAGILRDLARNDFISADSAKGLLGQADSLGRLADRARTSQDSLAFQNYLNLSGQGAMQNPRELFLQRLQTEPMSYEQMLSEFENLKNLGFFDDEDRALIFGE